MSICPLCKKDYEGVEYPPGERNEPVGICPRCISDKHESDMARSRRNRVHYYKELVVIGKAEFECSGYYDDGRLWDEEVSINGQDVYGLLSDQVEAQIYEEICRRVVSSEIIVRLKEIEKELPDSKDPATLRLKRSDWEDQLEKLEAKHE
ncbi:hypothetical protein KA005_14085 [bacterium]|nr:hypothetical protein [bacterium]